MRNEPSSRDHVEFRARPSRETFGVTRTMVEFEELVTRLYEEIDSERTCPLKPGDRKTDTKTRYTEETLRELIIHGTAHNSPTRR